MASHRLPPPVGYPKPSTPTTISDLDDDLLREIFLRLPDLPSLASAAFTCRTFLGAVRSSPAFRRRFRALHAPPLLALFLTPHMYTVPAFSTSQRPSDPDLAAAAGFAPLRDDDSSEWGIDFSESAIAYDDGFIILENRSTKQEVYYNPQTSSLILYPKKPHDMPNVTSLEFYTLSLEEDQGPSRVVCVRHDRSWTWARVAVFSSETMEWQIFPETATLLPEGLKFAKRTAVDGFICWTLESMYILVLNTDTFQFSRMDLPSPLIGIYSTFKIGQTKDGKLCIVSERECSIFVWIWTASDDGVERFVLHKMFPLHTTFMEVTRCSVEAKISVRLMAVLNGFLYLSIHPWQYMNQSKSAEWFLSFSLETAELNEYFKSRKELMCPVYPYVAWPSSLVYSKENSAYEVTGAGDVGSERTEKASSVLIAALHSFEEALIKDDEANVAEIEAFSLSIDVQDEKSSLVRKITVLDALLTTVRDRVLRVGAEFRQKAKTESWWQMCKGKLWRAFFASS